MTDTRLTGRCRVTTETFVRAVTDLTMGRIVREAGLARFNHHRQAPQIDAQPVIRMNQDTLYSMAVLDLTTAASLILPQSGARYMSAQIISQDHHTVDFFHAPGPHEISQDAVGTRYAAVLVRFFVNIHDPDDLRAVNALQDELRIDQAEPGQFTVPDWDYAGFEALRNALQPLTLHLGGNAVLFGRKAEVDPVAHLIGAAIGWGGLPRAESVYVTHVPEPGEADKLHSVTIAEVPTDAFWSVTMYNRLGFMADNPLNVHSFNSQTAARNPDGTVTLYLGPGGDGRRNYLPSPGDGWNYLIRIYCPQDSVLNGSWSFPKARPVA